MKNVSDICIHFFCKSYRDNISIFRFGTVYPSIFHRLTILLIQKLFFKLEACKIRVKINCRSYQIQQLVDVQIFLNKSAIKCDIVSYWQIFQYFDKIIIWYLLVINYIYSLLYTVLKSTKLYFINLLMLVFTNIFSNFWKKLHISEIINQKKNWFLQTSREKNVNNMACEDS